MQSASAGKAPLEPILVCGDVHRPFHHRKAWQLFLKVGKALKPTHLWNMGDFADFYKVSSHSKDPSRMLSFDDELADVRQGFDELDALGATNKVFCPGNHCDRLRRYLEDKAPELYGVVSIPSLFGLQERGWKYVPYKDHLKVGKIHLTHDVGVAGRYSVHKALDTYQHSVITGHSHRLCYVVEGNATGETKISAAFGWMGDVSQIDYMTRVVALKNWALGFGVGYLDPSSGVCYLTPVPIVKVGSHYTVVVNGELFQT